MEVIGRGQRMVVVASGVPGRYNTEDLLGSTPKGVRIVITVDRSALGDE